MKIVLAIILSFWSLSVLSQSEKEKIDQRIHSFFNSMAEKDTTALRTAFAKDATLQTIIARGNTLVRESSVDEFLKQIGELTDHQLDEQIHDLEIRTDSDLAMVWAPYRFTLDDCFSHCGVNLFQLIKVEGEWLILPITDTRRMKNCDNN